MLQPVQAQGFLTYGNGVVIGNTSIILTTFLDINGNQLTMSNFGTVGTFTIEPNNGSQEEQCIFTGVTANANGTTTLTGISSVGFESPYTQTSGFLKNHAGGTTVALSDTAYLYSQYANLAGANTFTGTNTFNLAVVGQTPTASNQLATKGYVDGVAIAGAAKASTTVFGISELSTAPVTASVPIAVGDNDTRVPTQGENDALVGQSGTAVGSTNKFEDAADVDTAATASKVVRRIAAGQITVPATPSATTDAASKGYVDLAGPAVYKNGQTTYNMATASGGQNIAHGLGKTPKFIKIFATFGAAGNGAVSSGTYNGTTNANSYLGNTTGTPFSTAGGDTTNVVNLQVGSSSYAQVAVATFDATNIGLTWTKTGSPTGTAYLMWEAFA